VSIDVDVIEVISDPVPSYRGHRCSHGHNRDRRYDWANWSSRISRASRSNWRNWPSRPRQVQKVQKGR
jgi:hypothetical protein